MGILKSFNMVNLYRTMSILKLKINIKSTSVVVCCRLNSAALNGEFELSCYYTLLEEEKGRKLIFDRSSAKPIFTQKLE